MERRKIKQRHIDDGDHEIVADGERLHVPLYAQDGIRREITRHAATFDGEVFDASQHRPGFRATDHVAEDRREAARAQWIRDTENAWKSDARREANIEAACENARDAAFAADDAQRVRDAAYRSYVERITNAWKGGAA